MKAEQIGRGHSLIAGAARFERHPGLFARFFAPGFHKVLDRLDEGIECGSITGHLPDGTTRILGGRNRGFDAIVNLNDWRALIRLATKGSIGCYQAWEAGEWDSPDPVPLFALFMANGETLGRTGRAKGLWRLAAKAAHWLNRNTPSGAKRNIAVHYDLGNDFYSAWLDPTMSYSSALYEQPQPLQMAQVNKWHALAERLGEPSSVLEIGCGWGGLSDYLARRGAQVTAISLSDEQLEWARSHYPGPDFRKQDYRDTDGRFDAIVCVEMVEALGREYWPTFMDCVTRNLKPGGRAAIQFISMKDELFDAYASSADFIQAYVFPGGMLIRTSEFRGMAEARGLEWRDQTNFGADYAETLRCWRHNFDRAISENRLPDGFDRRFQDLWRYYLMYCEGGFRGGGINVHQVTLVKT